MSMSRSFRTARYDTPNVFSRCRLLVAVAVVFANMPAAVSAQSQIEVNRLDGLKYVWIPPGTFQMGCSSGDSECESTENPAHSVTLTKGFWIGETLVTQDAFKKVTGNTPSHFNGKDLPVEQVTLDDADSYCKSMNMRVPTEAEWEYAARGGSPSARYGTIDRIAWYGMPNRSGSTHPVTHKQPNAFGLYDMLGNVWEWTADWVGPYAASDQRDPTGPSSGLAHVLRGGSWMSDARSIRVSSRYQASPYVKFFDFGFRCVANGQDLSRDVLPQGLVHAVTPNAVVTGPAAPTPSTTPPNPPDRAPASTSSAYVVLSKSSDENRYFVVFAARGSTIEIKSWTGHAFVVWGIEDTRAQKSSYTAFGMYPKDPTKTGDKNAAFGAVPKEILIEIFGGPGEIRDEATMHSIGGMTNDLIVEVDKRQYDASLNLAMMTMANPSSFQLLKSDCVTFMSGIALTLLGQDVPARDLKNSLPQAYVADLIRAVTTPKTITRPGITYTGQTWFEIPNGDGTLTLSTGDKFTGHMVMGFPRNGTMTFPSGNTYAGTFRSGLPDGPGTFTWTGTGEHLDAQFEKGDPKHGTYYWKDGKTLTGDLKAGKFAGAAVMKLPDGSTYEGDWSSGKPQGHGTLTLADGSRYEGDWSSGKPQGHGTLTLADGSRYEGDWSNGRQNGSGTVIARDGSRANGTWKDGKLDVEHAHYRDVDGREHGFEAREGRESRGDDMTGRVEVKDSEGRTVESHPIRGMEIEGGHGDD